jgi:hypothetical protein
MFPLNTIIAWSINIIMNKKYDNNNIIIASRAYFLHPHGEKIGKRAPRPSCSTAVHSPARGMHAPAKGPAMVPPPPFEAAMKPPSPRVRDGDEGRKE